MKLQEQQLICWGTSQIIQQLQKSQGNRKYKSLNIYIRIHQLSCGQQHILILSNEKKVFGFGKNTKGQLGNDDFSLQVSQPIPIVKLQYKKIKTIRCGWYHNIVLSQNNEVYSWGQGDYGALGYNNSILTKYPKKVNLLLNYNQTIKNIQCGSRYTFILTNINKIYAFGNNDLGQLGIYKQKKYFLPQSIVLNQKIEQISCGISHTIFLTKQGKLFGTGSNNFGQLGIGNKQAVNKITPLITKKNFISVRCGHHSCAISNQNQLYVWGTGAFGQFLIPTKLSQQKIKRIHMGSTYGFAESYSEKLYSWGSNICGQLAHEDFQPRSSLSAINFISGQKIKSVNCGNGFVILMRENKKVLTQRQVFQRNRKQTKRDFTGRDFSLQKINEQKIYTNQTIKNDKSQKICLQKMNKELKQKNKQFSGEILKLNEEKYELMKNLNFLESSKRNNQEENNQNYKKYPPSNVNNKESKIDEFKSKYLQLLQENKKINEENKKLLIQKAQILQKYDNIQKEFAIILKNKQALQTQIQQLKCNMVSQKKTDQQNIQQINELKSTISILTIKIKDLQKENQNFRMEVSQYKIKNYFPDITLSLSQFIPIEQFQMKQIKKNYTEEIQNCKKLLILKQKQIRKQKKLMISEINRQLEFNVSFNDRIINETNHFENCIQESQSHLNTIKNIINDLYNQLKI